MLSKSSIARGSLGDANRPVHGNDDDDDDRSALHRQDSGSESASQLHDPDDNIVSFSRIHLVHTRPQVRPENTGALSANPRVERQMQKLCGKLERNTRKIATIGPDAPGQRKEILLKQRQDLTGRMNDCMRLLDPNLAGTVMERAKSDATRDLELTYQRVWDDYQHRQKGSCTKYLWTFLAGGVAYSIPFGTATMLSRWFEMPYLVPPVAGLLHTLAEPLWTMVRATTWTNPASVAYVGRQRARARANGDAWRYLANVQPKAKMLWTDPLTGKRTVLTAAQALATNQELWLWLHKTVSDDVPFFIFSLFYSIKNVMREPFGPELFDRSTPNGMRNDLAAQFAAGFLSGAVTMLVAQGIRRGIAGATKGSEVATKSRHVWSLQARFLGSYAEDIRDMLTRSNLSRQETRLLRAKLREVQAEQAMARAKSWLPGSVFYEFSVMFQKKRVASGSDPDMPGKRLDTLCSILGKMTSLLPSLAVGMLCQPLAKSPDMTTRLIAHLAVPFSLVTWPGFAMRTELQDWYLSLFGACKGMVSAMRAGCCCAADDPDESATTRDSDDDEDSQESTPDEDRPSPGSSSHAASEVNPDGSAQPDVSDENWTESET